MFGKRFSVAKSERLILTTYTSYDMFLRKEVPYGVAVRLLPLRGSSPQKLPFHIIYIYGLILFFK